MDDQSVDTATTADASAGASTASSADASASTLTDDHHDWASSFCGIDTRADAPSSGNGNGSSSSDSGGIWGAIKGAASSVVDAENVVSDVGHTVADAADDSGGLLGTLSNAASAATNVVSTGVSGVEQVAGGGDESGAIAAAAMPAPAPDPGIVEEVEEGVRSGVRLIGPLVPEAAEAGGIGVAGMAGIAVAAAVGGVALAVGVGYLISHGEEVDQQPDPDEQKPDGGLPAGVGPDGLPGQPIDPQPGTGGDCGGLLQAVFDQLKLLEQLFEEATTDERHLWEKEQQGIPDDSGTTWSGHRKAYEAQRDELRRRIAAWESGCQGMNLDDDQREELEMAKQYAQKDFPDKPEYAK